MTNASGAATCLRRVLVIGARDTSFAGARAEGLAIDLVQGPQRLTPFQTEHADRVVLVNLDDATEITEAAVRLHSEHHVEGVVAFHEHLLAVAADVARVLGVRGTCAHAVASVADKGATRRLAEGSGIRNPRYVVPDRASDWQAAATHVGWPAIVKPLAGAGSAGVRLARTPAELDEVASRVATDGSGWIIEEYLNGPEFSVETFTGRLGTIVRGVTEKIIDPDTFVEVGHQAPARISIAMAEQIEAGVKVLMANVGLNVGPGHTEVKVVDGDPYLIETHVRYGGDRIWQMTGLTTGFYPQAEMLAELAGVHLIPSVQAGPAAAIRFLTCPPGIVTGIEGRAAAASTAGVVEVNVGVRCGDRVQPLRSSDDRVGFVLTVGDSTAEAEAAADRALGEIQITTVATWS